MPFKVSYPTTTIIIPNSGKETPEQQPPDESSNEPSAVPETEPKQEYAWVLVDTIHETYQANIDNTNKNGVYEVSASASPGSYTYSWKYVRESDDWYDPDMIHGESYATQLSFSVPPNTIKGGEMVSLDFSLSFTEQNLSFFDGRESCRADWGNLRFKSADGKNSSEIYSSVKYNEKNVFSVSGTISAVIPAGYSEGDREELWTGDTNSGTYYIYEWRAQ